MMFESKAQADEKAQHTCEYVSILKRTATQVSDIRWGFENTSKQLIEEDQKPKRKIGYVKEKQAGFGKKRTKN
jgi:hypothetical protein